jgi:NAD(P)-dependent dehydrogenase (short-subunit alcohol dehydrogenase family)
VLHDGKQFHTVASLQAGDIICEMAIITGVGTRNVSVVARTPVTVCAFAEETFAAFIETKGFRDKLLNRWSLRPIIKNLPQFHEMTSTVLEKVGSISRLEYLDKGDSRRFDESAWYILCEASVEDDEGVHVKASEFGWLPFAESNSASVTCLEDTKLIKIKKDHLERLRLESPQLNYYLRKQRVGQPFAKVDWLLDIEPWISRTNPLIKFTTKLTFLILQPIMKHVGLFKTIQINHLRRIMDIKGKVAVITGGASGLGEATARRLTTMGAKVAIFDRDAEKGAALAEELDAGFYSVNVVDEDQVQEAITDTVATFGAIHICCNYAGVGYAARTVGREGAYPLDKFKRIIDINLIGTFNVLRLAAFEMAKNEPYNKYGGRGCIINTASAAAFDGQIGQAAYSASKAGVVGMTLPIARDLSSMGIRVNTIAPGLIRTPLLEGASKQVLDALSAQVLYPKRLGEADEIAHVAITLMENEYLNAEVIRMDGGIRMQAR